jgi:hypothetical protein
MSVPDRRLVLLDARYPDVSRMTRGRIEHEKDFPTPIIVRGRKYYDDAELTEQNGKNRAAVGVRPSAMSDAPCKNLPQLEKTEATEIQQG